MKLLLLSIGLIAAMACGACGRSAPREVVQQFTSRPLYTCCALRYEGESISDVNFHVGTLLPLGTPVVVEKVAREAIAFRAAATRLTLSHSYGTAQETASQYFAKILVPEDPKQLVDSFPRDVQRAIRDGRILRGMTKEQVILALGYPPTHRTPTLEMSDWTYWHTRWNAYQVHFDDHDRVSGVSDTGRWSPLRESSSP